VPFLYHGEMKYFTFNFLNKFSISHGVFCRKGGVSPKPWESLNLGGTNGDVRDNVIENRKRIFSVFQLEVNTIFDTWQVHGTNIICADRPRRLDETHPKADGILTNSSDITLFMRFADCVPLLFYDPVKGVIGIGHAGWMGTKDQIARKIVEVMVKNYHCRLSDIAVGIGPSIGPDHYEVGVDVFRQYEQVFRSEADEYFRYTNGKIYLDLWKANEIILRLAGIINIETCKICTGCNVEDWYSHRVENGRTGRFGVLLSLSRRENLGRIGSEDPKQYSASSRQY